MPNQSASHRWWIIGVIALTLAFALIAALTVIRPESPVSIPGTGPASSKPTRTEPPPPAPQPPYSVVDSQPLTLPDEFRYADGDFYLREGKEYLVRFDLTTTKPENEPGIGMYLGASFSCQSDDESPYGSIGGTENLLPGEPAIYTNHIVLEPKEDGVYNCSVLVNAPNDDVAAKGATVDLDVTWEVTEIDGTAVEADSEERLPTTVIPDSRAIALQHTVPVDDHAGSTLHTVSSLHVTTCTGVNGSREHGKVWCGPTDIDEDGNSFHTELRADILDDQGEVCDTVDVLREPEHLDKWRHHQLIPVELDIPVPEKPCGSTLRVATIMDNQGPASIVVHESNSSLITVG